MSSATKLTPDNISFKIGRKIDINTIEELELSSLGYIDATSSFSRLKCLKKLDLSSNRFQLVRNIKGLFDLPVVEDLNLSGNPVTKQNNYRLIIIQNLPTLLILDEKKITATERNAAREFDANNVVRDPLKKDEDEEVDEQQQVTVVKQEEKKPVVVNNVKEDNDDDDEKPKKKLFEDEDSLFGNTKKTQKKKLFESDDDEANELSLESIDLSKLEKKKPVEKKKSSIIFDSDDDGEDSIFGKGSNKQASTKSSTNTTKKSSNVDDLDDDLFGGNDPNSNSNLSSDFDISSYINSQKSRTKSSLFDD